MSINDQIAMQREKLASLRADRSIKKAMQFDRIEEYQTLRGLYFVSVKPAGVANQVEDRGVLWLPINKD